MSAPEGVAYQSNFKILAGLHNVYATNGADYIEQLDFFEESAVPKLVSIEQKIQAATNVAAVMPVQVMPSQPAAPVNSYPGGEAPAGPHTCSCGLPMKYVAAGISKASGKPYPAFYTCVNGKQGCGKTINV